MDEGEKGCRERSLAHISRHFVQLNRTRIDYSFKSLRTKFNINLYEKTNNFSRNYFFKEYFFLIEISREFREPKNHYAFLNDLRDKSVSAAADQSPAEDCKLTAVRIKSSEAANL
jgi:hypothetical protein